MKKNLKFTALAEAIILVLMLAGCANPAAEPDSSGSSGSSSGGSTQAAPARVLTDRETPLTLEAIEDGTITITYPWSTMKYSIDGGELQVIGNTNRLNSPVISVSAGNKVCFYADGSENYYNTMSIPLTMKISCSNQCYVYGNIMSLIDSENFVTAEELDTSTTYTFASLFINNTQLQNHSEKKLVLPATSLSADCYQNLFNGCTSLTSAPDLPAQTLVRGCYAWMFKGCTSLTRAPELPAQTLTASCYNEMFSDCSSLNYVKCLATNISESNCTNKWLHGVANTGTFVKASSTNWSSGENGIPNGWTIPDTGTITISDMTNGSITSNTSIASYGETVTLTLHPAEGYQLYFFNVRDNNNNSINRVINGTREGSTITFTMPESNVVVSATFEIASYNIYTSGPGTIRITNFQGSGTPSVRYNTRVTLQYFPSWGYTLDTISVKKANNEEVTLTGSGTDTRPVEREFTMPASNVTITVTQRLRDNRIDTSSITNLTVTAPQTAKMGDDVTLTFAPRNGYDLDTVTVRNSSSSTGSLNVSGSGYTRTFRMDWDDVTVTATYKAQTTTSISSAGDIVLSDGTYISYENISKMNDAQKASAVAVIFDAANKKGIGLENTQAKGCSTDAAGYNTNNYAKSASDGAANTAQIRALNDFSRDKYPAFYFAANYSATGFTSGWYLPAEEEGKIILSKRTSELANAFAALGKNWNQDPWIWSSSQLNMTSNNPTENESYRRKAVYCLGEISAVKNKNENSDVFAIRVFE